MPLCLGWKEKLSPKAKLAYCLETHTHMHEVIVGVLCWIWIYYRVEVYSVSLFTQIVRATPQHNYVAISNVTFFWPVNPERITEQVGRGPGFCGKNIFTEQSGYSPAVARVEPVTFR